jgi:hypothetical protein
MIRAPARRTLLRSSAALLLAGAAASSCPELPPGDADLLAVCAAFAVTAQAVVRLEQGDGPGRRCDGWMALPRSDMAEVAG